MAKVMGYLSRNTWIIYNLFDLNLRDSYRPSIKCIFKLERSLDCDRCGCTCTNPLPFLKYLLCNYYVQGIMHVNHDHSLQTLMNSLLTSMAYNRGFQKIVRRLHGEEVRTGHYFVWMHLLNTMKLAFKFSWMTT